MTHTDGRPEEPFLRRAERLLRLRRAAATPDGEPLRRPNDHASPSVGSDEDLEPPTLESLRTDPSRRDTAPLPTRLAALVLLALSAILLGIWTWTWDGRSGSAGPPSPPAGEEAAPPIRPEPS